MSAAKVKKRGWLVFIPADPTKEIYREGFSEKAAPYDRLRKAVGGLIQPVKLQYEGRARDGYVNEEGIVLGMRFNRRASSMFGEYWNKRAPAGYEIQVLYGDAVLVFWEKIEPSTFAAKDAF